MIFTAYIVLYIENQFYLALTFNYETSDADLRGYENMKMVIWKYAIKKVHQLWQDLLDQGPHTAGGAGAKECIVCHPWCHMSSDNPSTFKYRCRFGTGLPYVLAITSIHQVVFIDTVGFISDIPTPLVASFSSTLEDALQADLLLHVRDLSHPDTVNQNTQVLTTLKRLGASKEALDSMVTVGNKVDLLSEEQLLSSPCLPVSATLGLGLDHLARQELTPKIFSACDLKELTARYNWKHCQT